MIDPCILAKQGGSESHDQCARVSFAFEAARASSKLTLEYFGLDEIERSEKTDGTPVTVADRECELDLRERIKDAYPDDSILGEEFPDHKGTSGYQWVIDPIDGTISFVHGVPLYGTMLACLKDGDPILGVIVLPALKNETIYAAHGLGCWLRVEDGESKQVRVSEITKLSESMVGTTSMSYFESPPLRSMYEQIDARSKHTRGWSDCYAWVLLASGRVDAVVEPVLSLWDFAAAIPIVLESGGQWSDLSGNQDIGSGEMIASNGKIHDELLECVRAHLGER